MLLFPCQVAVKRTDPLTLSSVTPAPHPQPLFWLMSLMQTSCLEGWAFQHPNCLSHSPPAFGETLWPGVRSSPHVSSPSRCRATRYWFLSRYRMFCSADWTSSSSDSWTLLLCLLPARSQLLANQPHPPEPTGPWQLSNEKWHSPLLLNLSSSFLLILCSRIDF